MSDGTAEPVAGGDGARTTFTCDGRTIPFTPGQSIAGALWAHGDRALSRSIKYHRPRGFSCGIGKCADCSMRVDGIPDVRTCVTPARDDARVEGQNGWPSVRWDMFRASDLAFWRGLDHHHGFVRPRFLYPLFTATMRRFAGWGRLPDADAALAMAARGRTEAVLPDVLVVGGGPAGLAAAVAAARAGAGVLVLDEGGGLGGHATRMLRPVPDPDDTQGRPAACAELVARWRAEVRAEPRIEVRHRTALAAAYRDGLFLALGDAVLAAVRPRATVVATGGYDAQAEFVGNDLPGVMSATACQALLHREGVVPGRRAVVYGCGAHGAQVALDLAAAGVDVAAVVEPAAAPPAPAQLLHGLAERFLPVMAATRVVRAHGWGRLRGVTLQDAEGRSHVPCDVLVVALGRKTSPEVFQSLGARLVYDPLRGGAVPVLTPDHETSVPGVFAAGDAAGVGTLATARAGGRVAGAAAAAAARARARANPLTQVPA